MKQFAQEGSDGKHRAYLSGAQRKAMDRRFERTLSAYQKQLAKLEGRTRGKRGISLLLDFVAGDSTMLAFRPFL